MSRFQLSLNVDDVDASVDFYTKMLGVDPVKHRPGYANFVVADPPLKLVIVEGEGVSGSLNHLGIEFDSGEDVAAEAIRVADAGLAVEVDDTHTCCFATQEKAWTRDVDGVPWELYTVIADTAGFGASPRGGTPLDVMLPPVELAELRAATDDESVVIIDAQGPGGYEREHIPGAVNFDLDRVREQGATYIGNTERRVIVYCTDGDCCGAETVGAKLVGAGYTNIGRYPAGIDGWRTAGLTVGTAA